MFGLAGSDLRRCALALVGFALVAPMTVQAQEAPFNVGLVGSFDQADNYADIWGEGDFAYIARFGVNEINIVDIADPANPQLAATYDTGVAAPAPRM